MARTTRAQIKAYEIDHNIEANTWDDEFYSGPYQHCNSYLENESGPNRYTHCFQLVIQGLAGENLIWFKNEFSNGGIEEVFCA